MGASSKALTLTMSQYELEIIKARVSRLSTTYVLLFLALHLKIDVHPSFNYYFHSQFSLSLTLLSLLLAKQENYDPWV